MIIDNENQYELALAKLEKLIIEDKVKDHRIIDKLADAIVAYEEKHYPIGDEA